MGLEKSKGAPEAVDQRIFDSKIGKESMPSCIYAARQNFVPQYVFVSWTSLMVTGTEIDLSAVTVSSTDESDHLTLGFKLMQLEQDSRMV